MKLRQLVILGLLVFLNGFIFTVLLLMVSRELARPVATPTQLSTATPTVPPTYPWPPPRPHRPADGDADQAGRFSHHTAHGHPDHAFILRVPIRGGHGERGQLRDGVHEGEDHWGRR